MLPATQFVDHEKEEIIKAAGDISGIEVMYNQLLVGIYIRPEKTRGGIILADQSKDEDKFQGKVGLVLKVGPTAFVSDGELDFAGQKAEVGDWVVYRVGDGWQLKVGQRACRMLADRSIKLKISDPSLVF